MSDEEFDRKIQQLRNEGYDDFADAINGLRAEITAERQASEREVADGLEFRNHIAALLPESWYADLPVGKRIRLLVEQWQKLHVSHVELTAECDGLRKQFHTQAEHRDFVGKLVDNMPHAQIAAEFEEFKAEVADALAALRAEWIFHRDHHYANNPELYERLCEIEIRIGELEHTTAKLGLAPKGKAMSEPTTAEICDCANTGPNAINTCHRVIRGRVEPPCDCDCHKPTRKQKCADLARAMGYTTTQAGRLRGYYGLLLPSGKEVPLSLNCTTEDECFLRFAPNPYDSAEDSRALVAWMATQQRHIQQRFVFAVRDETTDVDLCYELRILTAEPAVIAEAAWLAIKEDSSASQ